MPFITSSLQERVTTVKGEEAAKGTSRTDAQVYNYVAKGATKNSEWLSKGYADALNATRIEPDVIKNVLGLKNLNTIKVNTEKGQGIEVSYFVTRSGDVFVWPPYEYEEKFYVNDDKSITVANSDATSITFGTSGVVVGIENAEGNNNTTTPVGPGVQAANTASTAPTTDTTCVYWYDVAGAKSPRGWESINRYSDGSAN